MTKTTTSTGSCLCRAVKVKAKAMSHEVGACHCSMCRQWGGGPLLVVDCGTDVEIMGEENVSAFASSEWAERGFCTKCGTHLFYKLTESQQYIVPVGLFTEANDLEFANQIFIESKPSYYEFANETKNMTGEEVFAQFAPSGD